MIKKLLLSLFLLFGFFTFSQETYVPDDNFENYLETHDADGNVVAVGNVTSMGNGIANDNYVTISNISSVTALDISNLNINDLTGIEAFQSLSILNANSNSVSSIDLSANLALTELYMVSNDLVHLDLTTNINLLRVDVADNDLISFDFRNGMNGFIQSFRAIANYQLFCIAIDDENLSSLVLWDVDSNTSFDENCEVSNIPDDNFEAFLEANNMGNGIANDDQVYTVRIKDLISLDVSNQNINNLEGLAAFESLEVLNCSQNNITSLDLSANTTLIELTTESNPITSLNLTANINLLRVDVDDNDLTYFDFRNGMNGFVQSFSAIANYNLTCINVDDSALSSLALWNVDPGTSFSEDCGTHVPDDNFENHLETHDANGNVVAVGDASSMGNGVANDNYVTTSRIASVADLDISNLSISDITGIEGFIGLQELNCADNSMTSLDFSQNTLLETLRCNDNLLSSLNVSQNTALQILNCYNNSLTSLDISQNVALTLIQCFRNNITALDVTNNIALDRIDVYRNELTTLDISQNTELTSLNCAANQLTSLDVSQNTKLEKLTCYENNLASLDVTNLPLLADLDCVDNELTSLDVSQNPLLEELQVYENLLTSLDVNNNVKLVELYAEYNQITSLDLSNNPVIEDVSLYSNQLTYLNLRNGNNTGFDTRDFDITNNPNLTCVAVDDPAYANANLADKDVQTVYNTFCVQTRVPDDNFEAYLETHNSIGGVVPVGDPTSLGNGIANDDYVGTEQIQNITYLNISDQGITDFTGLEGFASLETLFVYRNTASSLDLTANSNLIEVNCATMGLTSINISGLTSLEIVRARENNLMVIDLSSNLALKTLNLDKNNFNSIDISTNTALVDLRVRENSLTTLDITTNTSLTRLFCKDNSLSSIDVTNNTLLENLNCGKNQFTTIDVSTLTNLTDLFIEDTPTLTSLDVSSNTNLQDIGVDNNTSLTSLDLTNNEKLIEVYTNNTSITKLDFGNSPDVEYVECQNNTDLTYLNFKNGNTSGIDEVYATGNTNLTCIRVDDPSASYLTRWDKDATANFAEYCRLTYVPDDVFEDFLENNGYGNGIANDDYVYTALVEVSEGIIFQNKTVENMTGIEDFKEMWYLVCRNNPNLTSIDLSKNTKLTTLGLQNNSLTSLDLSNNTLLDKVYISDNDNLGPVDVSALANLTTLDVSNTGISTVDISNNPLLRVLNLNDNQFTTLDISAYPSILQLRIANNGLTSLNVANGNNANFTWFDALGNPDLTCIEVDDGNPDAAIWHKDATANYALYCELTYIADTNFENYLETHDANGNMVSIGDATSMGNGIANDNQVATSKIETVITLNIESQNVANLTGIEAFIALESFNCDYNDIATLDLSSNVNLKVLNAAENNLATLNLTNYTALEEVYLRSNNLTSLLVDNNPNLKKLSTGKNLLTILDVTSCTQLEELVVHQNLLESLDVRNGNNNLMTDFFVLYNPNLACIQVDDSSAAYLAGWEKDDTASFSEDCVPPVITLIGDNPQTIELGSGYTELGAIVDDGITEVTINSLDFMDAVGDYTITYNATDASGNLAVEVTRTVNVVDTTAPVITLLGDNPQTIELGAGYTELGATIDDGSDIVIDATGFVDAIGNYTITYNATDASGNAATEVTRTVNVVDTTVPVITLTGSTPQIIELGDGYTELGASTDDGSTIVIDTSDFIDVVGSYTIRYNASDASNNAAVEVTRTVNVINNCPIVSLPADNFTITTSSETCVDKDNGMITINATTDLDYVTTINGENYSFTSPLEVGDLSPGTYPICIAIAGFTNCEQCFEVVIEEAATLAGKTVLNTDSATNKVYVAIDSGTAPYTVMINDEVVAAYNSNSFSVEVKNGDTINVFSSLACEGKLSTKVDLFDDITAYPNPTRANVELTIPNAGSKTIAVEIHNALGVLVSSKVYNTNGGKVSLPMESLSAGIYFVRINAATPRTFKIVKQ